MPTRVVYCIDTSALIDLKPYPRDLFDVWDELARLVADGRLIAPTEVLKEIERQDDDLLRWARKHKKMFCKLDRDQIAAAREIERRFPGLVDYSKQVPDADPFVVALALARRRVKPGDDLFTKHEYVVVTQERLSRPGGKPRIPDVCQAYSIKCIRLLDMFRREKWRFTAGGQR